MEVLYPISVQLLGVLHKEKCKLYMTSVLWSDQTDVVIYRSFGEFKKMHKQMKKAFPPANKLRKSDKIIPRFRDKKLRQRERRQSPDKSLVRLKFLQKYCIELMSCDQRVSQSAALIQFFKARDQDLHPEFARSGIMIMPPEDELRRGGWHGNGGNVTQPFVSKTYRCVAPYETKDTKNKPFKVAVDEKLDVLIKDKAGWWLVESEDKRLAWFPAPYLEKTDDDDEDDDEIDETPERGALYIAVKSYTATKNDEVTINIGTVVEVLQKSETGWWLIRHSEKVGYIPTIVLQPYRYPNVHTASNYQGRRSSSPFLDPSSSLQQHSQFSLSQGNLLHLPPARSPSPLQIQPITKQKSKSLNVLSEQPPTRSTAAATHTSGTPTTSTHPPLPTITVEMDGEEEQRGRSLTADSEGSFESDSTEFSFSDELSSSSASSSFNLSPSANDEQLRLSRTPPPMPSNRLSPISSPEGKLIPSVSDPNIYKRPTIPKVPPRPGAQEILTRCTTITRKNAARGGASPTQTEIMSR